MHNMNQDSKRVGTTINPSISARQKNLSAILAKESSRPDHSKIPIPMPRRKKQQRLAQQQGTLSIQ